MSELLRKLKNDRRGVALVFFLVLVPLLLAVMIYAVNYIQATTESDIDVQRGLEQAVKAATAMVTQESQAVGRPKINTERAHAAFKVVLAANLGLDANTLQPLEGSAMKGVPNYVLVVYNGSDEFPGALKARKYRYWNGVLTETDLAASGFPYKFGVTSTDVLPGGGGVYNVTLDMPGTVAVVNTSVRKILGRDAISPVRYAAAKIVCPSGMCKP